MIVSRGVVRWLTVTMAVGRYMAVSHPFHVKPLIDLRSTRSTIMAIFVVSFFVNVPRFFENAVQSIPRSHVEGKWRVKSVFQEHVKVKELFYCV